MRILISAFGCDPYAGSEPNLSWSLSSMLADMGHEVWIITRTKGRENVEKEMALRPRPNLHFEFVGMPGWAEKIYKNNLGMMYHYIHWQVKAAARAKELDRKVNFDLVHHITWGNYKMGTAMYRLGKPLVFGPVGGGQKADAMYKEYFGKGWRTEQMRTLSEDVLMALNPLTLKAIRSAAVMVAANPDTEERLNALGARRVVLVPDVAVPAGFLPQDRPIRTPGSELKLLWIGRLFPIKGLPLILEALSKVDKSIPFKLNIVGYGTQEALIPGWIAKYGLEGRVHFAGKVPWDQVKRYYTESDALLQTSLRESNGTQFLEAMAYGLPIISWDYHGLRLKTFVPDQAAIKVPFGPPEEVTAALARAVEDFYRNPGMRDAMSIAGYEHAKSLSWPEKIKVFLGIYDEVLRDDPYI